MPIPEPIHRPRTDWEFQRDVNVLGSLSVEGSPVGGGGYAGAGDEDWLLGVWRADETDLVENNSREPASSITDLAGNTDWIGTGDDFDSTNGQGFIFPDGTWLSLPKGVYLCQGSFFVARGDTSDTTGYFKAEVFPTLFDDLYDTEDGRDSMYYNAANPLTLVHGADLNLPEGATSQTGLAFLRVLEANDPAPFGVVFTNAGVGYNAGSCEYTLRLHVYRIGAGNG